MSDTLIVGLLSGFVSLLSVAGSLIGVFVSAKNTQDKVTQKLDTNQQLMNNEIKHIKEEMGEMKTDIRSHNNYAKLFNENIPVIKEKLSTTSDRIKSIEKDIRYYHKTDKHPTD